MTVVVGGPGLGKTTLLAQAVSLAAIGLWAISRTVGLPVGPEVGDGHGQGLGSVEHGTVAAR